LRSVVVRERRERQPVGVVVVAVRARVEEQQNGSGNEAEAHEYLENEDVHRWLLPDREAAVARTTPTLVAGINTAAISGDIRPESANETVSALYASAMQRLRRCVRASARLARSARRTGARPAATR